MPRTAISPVKTNQRTRTITVGLAKTHMGISPSPPSIKIDVDCHDILDEARRRTEAWREYERRFPSPHLVFRLNEIGRTLLSFGHHRTRRLLELLNDGYEISEVVKRSRTCKAARSEYASRPSARCPASAPRSESRLKRYWWRTWRMPISVSAGASSRPSVGSAPTAASPRFWKC